MRSILLALRPHYAKCVLDMFFFSQTIFTLMAIINGPYSVFKCLRTIKNATMWTGF